MRVPTPAPPDETPTPRLRPGNVTSVAFAQLARGNSDATDKAEENADECIAIVAFRRP
ncbi:hypothetical protein Lesp01_40370 [Lentzea sp. NBRC 102530]|nr:hypothetical protein Lesp01_40370 [Lentzea sp. NBRC 102530]